MQRDDISALAKGMVPFVREVVAETNAVPAELAVRLKAVTEMLNEPLPEIPVIPVSVPETEPLRRVTSAVITRSGELALAYSDGSSERLGHVIGPPGERGLQGERGADGIGIKGDGGPPGRDGVSVQSATIRGGELIMTLSDGTVLTPGRVVADKKK